MKRTSNSTIYCSRNVIQAFAKASLLNGQKPKSLRITGSKLSETKVSSITVGDDVYISSDQIGWSREDASPPIELIEELKEEVRRAGFDLGNSSLTTGAVAMRAVKEVREKFDLMNTPKKSKWATMVESSIFGGRQELYHQRYSGVVGHVDMRGAYAGLVSRHRLPIDRPLAKLTGDRAMRSILNRDPKKAYLVTGRVRSVTDPGELPYKGEKQSICYPYGDWIGTYWIDECDDVLEDVAMVQVYPTSSCYSEMADRIIHAREYSAFPAFWKMVSVMFVGFIGQRGPDRRVIFSTEQFGAAGDKMKEGDIPLQLDGMHGLMARYSKPYHRPWTNLSTYSSILSKCRIELRSELRSARAHGLDVLACHTDGFIFGGENPSYKPSSGWLEKWRFNRGDFNGTTPGYWRASNLSTGETEDCHSGSAKGWVEAPWMGPALMTGTGRLTGGRIKGDLRKRTIQPEIGEVSEGGW